MSSGSSETALVPDEDIHDRNVLELLDHLDSFVLTRREAVERLRVVNEAVSHWAQDAVDLGAEEDEPESMKMAFEGANRERVANLNDDGGTTVIDLAKKEHTPKTPGSHAGARIWIDSHYRGYKLVPGHFRSKPSGP